MNPPISAPATPTALARTTWLRDTRLAFAADEVLEELPPFVAVCVKPMGPDSVVDEVAATEAEETLQSIAA